MQTTDRPTFRQLLTGIGMLYGKPLHDGVMDIYWQTLRRYAFEAVKAALQAHVRNPDAGQFMPKPADVIRQIEGGSESQAMKAWSLVAKAVVEEGSYASVDFVDPLISAVIREMGGWIALCQTKTTDLPFRAREFEKRYQATLAHPPTGKSQPLTGLIERHNRLSGYQPEPVCIDRIMKSTLLEKS